MTDKHECNRCAYLENLLEMSKEREINALRLLWQERKVLDDLASFVASLTGALEPYKERKVIDIAFDAYEALKPWKEIIRNE